MEMTKDQLSTVVRNKGPVIQKQAINPRARKSASWPSQISIQRKAETAPPSTTTAATTPPATTTAALTPEEQERKEREENLKKYNEILTSHPDTIPEEYKNDLLAKFQNGSLDAQKVLIQYVTGTSIKSGTYDASKPAHYAPGDNQVNMNYAEDAVHTAGPGTTYFHEIGHFIDSNSVSATNHSKKASVEDPAFAALLKSDFQNRLKTEAIALLNELQVTDSSINFSTESSDILDPAKWNPHYQTLFTRMGTQIKSAGDLPATAAHDNHNYSTGDLYGGLSIVHDVNGTGNNVSIGGGWGHDVSYWDRSPNQVTIEAGAHFFEAQFDPDKKALLEQYFPEAMKRYEEMLKILATDKPS